MELSVVLPVKGNSATIRATVSSLLAQDLDDPFEVIVVIDAGTPEFAALADLGDDARLRLVEPEPFPFPGGRDSNWRRGIGVRHACGSSLAFVDADMVFPGDWARRGLALLDNVETAAGVVYSADGLGFWGRYVDRNNLGAKTPRFARTTVLTRATLGRRGHKPPITANLFCRRVVTDRIGPPRPDITFNYDDYAFCQDIVDAGFSIVCDPALSGRHHHRHTWRDLAKEYVRSGRGCGQYVRCYPHSHLARRRKAQVALTLSCLASAVLGAFVAPAASLFVAATVVVALGLAQMITVRTSQALAYPVVTGVLGIGFLSGFLVERVFGRPVPVGWPRQVGAPRARATIDLVQIERDAQTWPRNRVVPLVTIEPMSIQAEVIAGEA